MWKVQVTASADESLETSDLQKEMSDAVINQTIPAAEDILDRTSVSQKDIDTIICAQSFTERIWGYSLRLKFHRYYLRLFRMPKHSQRIFETITNAHSFTDNSWGYSLCQKIHR